MKITWQEAEEIAECRLDRRRQYYKDEDDNEVFYFVSFRQCCTGCGDDREYHFPERGSGCEECGYHGVRITYWPIPVNLESLT